MIDSIASKPADELSEDEVPSESNSDKLSDHKPFKSKAWQSRTNENLDNSIEEVPIRLNGE